MSRSPKSAPEDLASTVDFESITSVQPTNNHAERAPRRAVIYLQALARKPDRGWQTSHPTTAVGPHHLPPTAPIAPRLLIDLLVTHARTPSPCSPNPDDRLNAYTKSSPSSAFARPAAYGIDAITSQPGKVGGVVGICVAKEGSPPDAHPQGLPAQRPDGAPDQTQAHLSVAALAGHASVDHRFELSGPTSRLLPPLCGSCAH
jgi:hypothetical protein